MTKSVLIYTPSLKFGGAEKALVTLANCLAGASYNVTYCYSEEGELAKQLKPSIPQINLAKPRMISSVYSLYKTLTKHKPDVVVTTLVHCNIMLMLISFIYNLFNRHQIKIIIRETTNITPRLEQMGRVKRFVFKSLMRVCYPRAKAVVFPNESLKVKFESYFGLVMNNGVVIYNSSAFNSSLIEDQREISFLAGEKLILLSVGRLTKTKRVEDLLYAVSQLPKELDVEVDIVGTGPEESNLKSLAKHLNMSGHVNFKGFLDNPFSFYSHENTVFVLTSELEGMPNALIEALCSGLPCISADCDFGPKEVFDKFLIQDAWLYEPSKINQLVKCITAYSKGTKSFKVNYKHSRGFFSDMVYLAGYKSLLK
ncbi:MAG: glycosyltransferase involved in cell wall biosynthesis [Glaciecola sp.]|jgi:glycosyltransferase involved in cell wall biosynthesis